MATYGFIPWLRQGIGNKIVTPSAGRATVQVEVTYSGDSPSTAASISRQMQMIGPGDITGISPDVIVRMEPANGVFDFESNYMPFIEFYDEDFPWRYTPVQNPADGRLVPWLALIVLKDEEGVIHPPEKDGLPGYIEVTGTKTDIFHNASEHWAWAHVHVHNPNAQGGNYAANLKSDLLSNPDVAISRLLCPRKLELNTQYTAFLIPAFETGRKVGLGEDASSVAPTSMSWSGTELKFPIYAQWRFGTSAVGDFETLVRVLKPIAGLSDWAGKVTDIAHSGMGFEQTFADNPSLLTTVFMEGALMTPAYAVTSGYTNMKDASGTGFSADAYTARLKDILNLGAYMQNTPGYISGNDPHPFFTDPNSTKTIQVDPVVLPPIYGAMHADVTTVNEPGSPKWLQNLNLDIRYRAAAGLGVQVVRTRQEELMAIAWKQIGEVRIANDKIEKAKVAIAASGAIYDKHFVASNFTSSAGTAGHVETIFKFGSQLLKNVQLSDPVKPSSFNPTASGIKMTTYSDITKASADAGFKKITRSRSALVEKMSLNVNVKSDLHVRLDDPVDAVSAAKDKSYVNPLTSRDAVFITQGSSSSGSSYSSSPGMTVANFSNAYALQKYQLQQTLNYYDYLETPFLAPPVTLTQSISTVTNTNYTNPIISTITYVGPSFVNDVITAIDPENAITDRVKKMIQLEVNGQTSALNTLDPVMAYPVFDEPTYDDLINISPEYLLPNPEKYPNNSVTLLETNQRFIEAFMVGLNHEFARELLWREYPTDQRGSYFRRFWDVKDSVDQPEIYDIDNIPEWNSAHLLGNNHTTKYAPLQTGGSRVVFLIRGDLLKKFPDTLIYMQKATVDNGKRILDGYNTSTGDVNTNNVIFPLFKANLQPDITLVGFNINETDAVGEVGSTTNPGWFVVFRERPGQVRFGMDEPVTGNSYSSPPTYWNDLNWGHMGSGAKTAIIDGTILKTTSPSGPVIITLAVDARSSSPSYTWGAQSAAMAAILYQRPSMVAIHCDDMIL